MKATPLSNFKNAMTIGGKARARVARVQSMLESIILLFTNRLLFCKSFWGMSEFKPCKDCKGSGFANRSRTLICSECGGSGNSKKRQRGHHTGLDQEFRRSNNKNLCPAGHLKKGITVDRNGDLQSYCEVCHRETVRRNAEKKKKGIPTNV